MFDFLKRLVGRISRREAREQEPFDSEEKRDESPSGFEGICGPPESDAPIVFLSNNNTLMVMDRMAYEYQQGMTPGDDPSQDSLDQVLEKATRVRGLDGGMYRDDSLGMNVLFEEADPDSIRELIDALRIVEDPSTFGHCGCLGEPTLEFFDDEERIATIAIHHGQSIRWTAWKHDAVLEDSRSLTSWMARRGIELGDGPRNPEDVMMMGLLSLTPANRFAARAWSYLQSGATERSQRELDLAEAADRELNLLPALRAETYLRLGRFEEGRESAENALRRGYRDANVLKTLAACLDALGRSEEALARCDEAIALEPDHPIARNSRAFLLGRLGRSDEARREYKESARLAPDWVLPVFQLASLEFETGHMAAALESLNRTIEILESSGVPPRERVLGFHSIATLHAFRASCRIALGDPEGAQRDADQAIAMDPEDVNGYLQSGRALSLLGRAADATDVFETLTRISPDSPQPWTFLAQSLANSADWPGALEAIDEAIRIDPNEASVFLVRAQILLQLDRAGEARDDMGEAIRIRPDEGANYFYRSYCSRVLGDHAQQLEDLNTARRWEPDDPRILNSLAWLLSTCPTDSVRDGPLAESLAIRAADLTDGKDSDIINTLAAALAENGKFDEARKRLRESVEMAAPGYNSEEREAMRRAFDDDRPFRVGPIKA